MRSVPILEDSYYHVFNRGNQKQILFHDQHDYARFLFLVIYFQSPVTFDQINRRVNRFQNHQDFGIKQSQVEKILQDRYVQVLNFCFMPNHFHLTVLNKTEAGLTKYMHRIGNAYAKYFNTKYDKTGHVFQGTYKTVLIETDQQLINTSAYIHNNPVELQKETQELDVYPWSSYQDYIQESRWGGLLDVDTIMSTFNKTSEYQQYTQHQKTKPKMSNT